LRPPSIDRDFRVDLAFELLSLIFMTSMCRGAVEPLSAS